MKTMSKALVGTIAAGAMAVSSAAPAFADSRGHDRDRGGISAGEIIAGALIIGGIAAIAGSGNRNDRDYRYGDYRDNDYRYDRAGYGYNGGYRDNPRQAVEQCVATAENEARRYSYGRADVTDIRQIRDTRYGLEVKGRIAINTRGRGWRHGDGNYGKTYSTGHATDIRNCFVGNAAAIKAAVTIPVICPGRIEPEDADRREPDHVADDAAHPVRQRLQVAPETLRCLAKSDAEQDRPGEAAQEVAGQQRIDRVIDCLKQNAFEHLANAFRCCHRLLGVAQD